MIITLRMSGRNLGHSNLLGGNKMKIGKIIQSYRRSKKITQKELAGLLSVSCVSLGKYEQDRQLPSQNIVNRLSEIIGIDLDYLIYEGDCPSIKLEVVDLLAEELHHCEKVKTSYDLTKDQQFAEIMRSLGIVIQGYQNTSTNELKYKIEREGEYTLISEKEFKEMQEYIMNEAHKSLINLIDRNEI